MRLSALRPLAAGLLAALVYWAAAALAGQLGKHPALYFDQLADAFLHGRLYLASPPLTHDLTLFQGRWYVPFPPGPALLMLPLAAALGPQAAFEVPFSAALGGLSVALVYLALRAMRERGWLEAGERACLWLTALFAFGTVHWVAAATASVWFLAHVVAVMFLALAVALAARQARPVWVGLALAGAVLTRPHLALALPFFLAELWLRHRAPRPPAPLTFDDLRITSRARKGCHTEPPVGRRSVSHRKYEILRALRALRMTTRDLLITFYALRCTYLLLPPALALAGLLWYNHARFGNALEFGYQAANADPALAQDLADYGAFSLRYLGRNARVAFAGPPVWQPRFPFFLPTQAGMSVFLTTPAFLYLFRRRPRLPWQWAAWGAILLLNLTVLLYYNTGWQQFGYRFSLDYTVFAVCLLGAGAGRRVSPLLAFLIVLSVLVNLRGVIWWFGGG